MESPEQQKPIHLVRCRECGGYHKVNIKTTMIGLTPTEPIPDEMMNEMRQKLLSGPIECRATGKTFTPSEDDWLHLTEDEFHRRLPEYRRSN